MNRAGARTRVRASGHRGIEHPLASGLSLEGRRCRQSSDPEISHVTLTPRTSASFGNLAVSGLVSPSSQAVTAFLRIPKTLAMAFCDRPFASRLDLIL
jgi:hypothetical protein